MKKLMLELRTEHFVVDKYNHFLPANGLAWSKLGKEEKADQIF
jgi:hypothetical protein